MATTPIDRGGLHELVELYMLGALTAPERVQFEAHLETCDECQARLRSLSPVVGALVQAVPQVDPPPSLRTRVLSSVGANVRAMPAPAPRRTSLLVPWLAAAASLVTAVALGGYSIAMRGRVSSLEDRLRDAARQLALSERQIAELRRTSAQGQFQMAVLAAPDLLRMDLAGQPAAPRSAGRAFWSRSRGLLFTASGLPVLPTGRTYQLWVLTARPAPISAGLFKPDAGGGVTTTFETPVDLPQPVGMAVTIEPDGGVLSPTGDKYLVGQ